MKTSCQHCIFAIRNKFIQTGCQFDRLDKFNYTQEDLHCIVDGFCNACRTMYWEPFKEAGNRVTPDVIQALNEEIEITYSVMVYYDGNETNLAKTLTSCRGDWSPVNVVVCVEPESDIVPVKLYDDMYRYYHPLIIHKAFEGSQPSEMFGIPLNKTSGEFVYCLDSGSLVDRNVIAYLNGLINNDIKQVVFVKGNNFSLVYKQLYMKTLASNKNMIDLYTVLAQSKLKDGIVNWPLS